MDCVKSMRQWASTSASNREQLRQSLAANSSPEAQLAFRFGCAYLILQQGEHAVETLKTAPESTEKRYLLGKAYKTLDNYKSAIAEFQRAINRGWDQVDGQAQIAECHRLAGQSDKAQEVLDDLAKHKPDSPQYHYQLARLLEEQGLNDRAVAGRERESEIDPVYHPAVFLVAHVSPISADAVPVAHTL